MSQRTEKVSYLEHVKATFSEIVNGLDLDPLQRRFITERWLDQVLWFEKKASDNQRRYYALRVVTIAGGVIVPAIVSLNVRQDSVATSLAWATFCVSLLVALSAALEGFFRYGERWRTFRRTSEALKAQGWQFFELAGAYAQARNHVAAFPAFVTQVEALVQQDIETFMVQAAQPQAQTGLQEDDGRDTSPAATSMQPDRSETEVAEGDIESK